MGVAVAPVRLPPLSRVVHLDDHFQDFRKNCAVLLASPNTGTRQFVLLYVAQCTPKLRPQFGAPIQSMRRREGILLSESCSSSYRRGCSKGIQVADTSIASTLDSSGPQVQGQRGLDLGPLQYAPRLWARSSWACSNAPSLNGGIGFWSMGSCFQRDVTNYHDAWRSNSNSYFGSVSTLSRQGSVCPR